MNSKSVLNKIIALLAKEEVKMTYAKLEDGTIVESPTFDVGEPVEVVTEEGKTPAPDGEHNLFLRDEEGNEVHIRVITKDGLIVERENVEELEEKTEEEESVEMADAVTEEVEPLPGDPGYEEMKVKMEEQGKKVEEMAYRIEELEKAMKQFMQEEIVEEDEDDEEELPSLNGAPVEMSKASNNFSKSGKNKVGDLQSSFLSKLYRN
jgi:hypothetical protein